MIDEIKNIVINNLVTKVPLHLLDIKRDPWNEPTISFPFRGRIIEQISIEGSFKYNDWNSWYKITKIMSDSEQAELLKYLQNKFRK